MIETSESQDQVPSPGCGRAEVPKLECEYQSHGDLVKM